MKLKLIAAISTAVLLGALTTSMAATLAPIPDLKSQLATGLVVLQPDPVLSDGRLIVRVVGFNQTSAPVTLKASDLAITTAGDAPVRITPLAQLIAEVIGQKSDGAAYVGGSQYKPDPSSMTPMNSQGQMDISGFTGSSGLAASPTAKAPPGRKALTAEQQKAQDAQVAGLKAAIRDATVIAPRAAAGGQVVTEKLKFKGSDKRGLKVTVTFAGEQHRFEFTAPPAK